MWASCWLREIRLADYRFIYLICQQTLLLCNVLNTVLSEDHASDSVLDVQSSWELTQP